MEPPPTQAAAREPEGVPMDIVNLSEEFPRFSDHRSPAIVGGVDTARMKPQSS
jgi:hypothetical protein